MVKESMTPGRRKALRNAAILALVALAFYAGIFLLVSWRHP
jgi:hypothetical protein